MPSLAEDTPALLDAIERGLGLESIIRYHGKFYFQDETARHDAAAAIEGTPRLESVADHSWHMAYMATLLLPYLPQLDSERVQQLIVLHDILELIVGDDDPTGSDGTGHTGHAFNQDLAAAKQSRERQALDAYLAPLPTPVATMQRALLEEELAGASAEAAFVKLLDKLQCVIFVRALKRGTLQPAGLTFFETQRDRVLPRFPSLAPLYDLALQRLADEMAAVQRPARLVS